MEGEEREREGGEGWTETGREWEGKEGEGREGRWEGRRYRMRKGGCGHLGGKGHSEGMAGKMLSLLLQ